jgi:RHS repeat-associated protein
VLELDDDGQIISYEEYYPYGSTSYQAGRSVTEVSLKRYRYTGMERDEETGFQYHTSRYFVPWLGRWASPDPIWGNDGPNLYIYSPSSPTRFTDTTGTGFMDFVGGFFDTVSFGLTRKLRNKVNEWTGADALPDEEKTINENSTTYKVGGYVGVGAQFAFAGMGLVSSVRAIGWLGTAEFASVATGSTILATNIADRIDPSGWTSAILLNVVSYVLPIASKFFPKTSARYIPADAAGDPVPLRQQVVKGEEIPLPDPRAQGAAHTVLGGKVSSVTGEVYRQSATFPDATWPKANGQDVPWSRTDWGTHGRPEIHTDPHQHIFTYDPLQRRWVGGPPVRTDFTAPPPPTSLPLSLGQVSPTAGALISAAGSPLPQPPPAPGPPTSDLMKMRKTSQSDRKPPTLEPLSIRSSR